MKRKSKTTYYAHPEGEPISKDELDKDIDKILFIWWLEDLSTKLKSFFKNIVSKIWDEIQRSNYRNDDK